MTYKGETLQIAQERAQEIAEDFYNEVERLLNSGAIDKENHSRILLFGVALENIADRFLRRERNTKDYKNLKCF